MDNKIEDLSEVKLITNVLSKFIKTHFNACEGFHNSLNACNTEIEIVRLFRRYPEDVYSCLGGESEYSQDDIDDKDSDIEVLDGEIRELEERIEELTRGLGDTLNGELKFVSFHAHHDKYDPWELDELLINGRKYLNK